MLTKTKTFYYKLGSYQLEMTEEEKLLETLVDQRVSIQNDVSVKRLFN